MTARAPSGAPADRVAQGLGCMGMSFAYAPPTTTSRPHHPPRPHLGVTFFDTADMYDFGHNEELVGRALPAGGTSRWPPVRHPLTRTTRPLRGRPRYVRQACDASPSAWRRPHRPLLPHRPDVTCPSRERSGPWPSWSRREGPPPRPVERRPPPSSAAATHPIAALHRVVAVRPGHRGRDRAYRRAGIDRPLQPARRACCRHGDQRGRAGRGRLPPGSPLPGRTARGPSPPSRSCGRSPGPQGHQGRVALAWLAARGDVAHPRHQAAALPEEGVAASTSCSPTTRWPARRAAAPAPATPRRTGPTSTPPPLAG